MEGEVVAWEVMEVEGGSVVDCFFAKVLVIVIVRPIHRSHRLDFGATAYFRSVESALSCSRDH